jgi:hypothetical protein
MVQKNVYLCKTHVDPTMARIGRLETYIDGLVSRIVDLECETNRLQYKVKQLERTLKEKKSAE